MKKPFLHALGAVLYIVDIILIINLSNFALKSQEGTLLIPMTMLSLFVLSAGVMGYFFLWEPLSLLIEKRQHEAIVFFGKTVAVFAGFVAAFGLVLLWMQNV